MNSIPDVQRKEGCEDGDDTAAAVVVHYVNALVVFQRVLCRVCWLSASDATPT